MALTLELVRIVVRPFASKAIGVPQLLESLWPMILSADDESAELAASIEDLLALHSDRSIDDIALRQRLVALAFPSATFVDLVNAQTVSMNEIVGGVSKPEPTLSDRDAVAELIVAA